MAFLGAAALLLIAAAAPAKNWSGSMIETESGWSIGNPAAKTRVVEYLSFGCGHCALFAKDAGPAIHSRVASGRLVFAVRPFLIFPQDRAAALLTRCVPAAQRLRFVEAVMADQAQAKEALAAADRDDVSRGTLYQAELAGNEAHSAAIAKVTGLDRLAASHGLPASKAAACLADTANNAWVTSADLAARVAGVTGTPTFELNGRRLGDHLTPAQLVEWIGR